MFVNCYSGFLQSFHLKCSLLEGFVALSKISEHSSRVHYMVIGEEGDVQIEEFVTLPLSYLCLHLEMGLA